MGVKGLWMILAPAVEKKSLWELKDQTIAIDLSGWICENESVDSVNSNLYLRNLFFRTSYLLLLGVKPVFILEGKAPVLKFSTIEARKKSRGNFSTQRSKGSRARLNSLQSQCEELLKCMGVPCYYSEGEAEALCAILNQKGLVDGVITQDSDCFLYGANTVFRNFNISSKGGSVEMYTISSLEEKLSLGRNKLIALSLLCGCDYNDNGVMGIGKESALRYLSTVADCEVLERISSWCDHPSEAIDTYTRSATLENKLRQKALKNPMFPFLQMQKEFLDNQMIVASIIKYEWKQPNIKNFVFLTERKLGWTADYSTEKFLPVLTRWYLKNGSNDSKVVELECVIKKRILRNVPSYEVKWRDFNPTTVEPMCILKLKFHHDIELFERTKASAKLKKNCVKKKIKTEIEMDDVIDELNCLSLETSPDAEDFDGRSLEDNLTVSDFECSAHDLLELSSIVESITSVH